MEATPAVFEVPAVCHAGWCLAPALSQVSGACLHPAPWRRPQPWHRMQECAQPAWAWRCAWVNKISWDSECGGDTAKWWLHLKSLPFSPVLLPLEMLYRNSLGDSFRLKKGLQPYAEKKMLRNFWTHNVPGSVGTFALSCTSANEPSWSWFVSASLVQIIWPWIIECWLYK